VSTTVRYGAPYILSVTGGQVSGVSAIQYSLPGGALVSTAPGATAALTINGLDGAALVTVPVPSLGSGSAAAPGVTLGVEESYGPFGEPLGTPSALGDGVPRYGWQSGNGWETLPGPSSVTLLGARPYQPALGEFLAPDPVLDSGSNAYGYTDGDPINTVDPDGNQSESVNWGAIAGAVASVAAAFAGGFLAGRFTGVARAIGAAVGVAGALGSAAATYIAASSELGTGAAAGVAVAAAAVSALTFFGGYRLGAYMIPEVRVKRLKTVRWADALVDGNGAATLDDIKWTSKERNKIAKRLARGQTIDSDLLQPLGRGRSAGVGSVSVSSPVQSVQRISEQLPVAPLRASADRAASVTSSITSSSSGSVVDAQQLLNDYLKVIGR
jgi:RHS repeat-associated protein